MISRDWKEVAVYHVNLILLPSQSNSPKNPTNCRLVSSSPCACVDDTETHMDSKQAQEDLRIPIALLHARRPLPQRGAARNKLRTSQFIV
eukprot:3523633-Amphidinium_carterae.1